MTYCSAFVLISDSISLGSGVFALFLSKFLNEKIGRKKSLISATILQVVSTFSVYFCNSFLSLATMIVLCRLLPERKPESQLKE